MSNRRKSRNSVRRWHQWHRGSSQQIRRKEYDKGKKKEVKLISDLQTLIQREIKTMALHRSNMCDPVLIQHGNKEQAFDELWGDLVELFKTKYPRNIV